jgi:hypothetical protein
MHVAACCAWLFISGCRTEEPEQARGSRPAITAVSDKPAVLAELPIVVKAPAKASPSGVGSHATPLTVVSEFIFGEGGGGVAYVAETSGKFRVVHNGRAGNPYAMVGMVVLNPGGRRCAHGALVDGKWRMVVDGREGASFSEVDSPVFSPDGSHVAYQAKAGESWHLVVDTRVNGGTRARYLSYEFGGDSSRIAFVEGADGEEWGRLVVSDLAFKKQAIVDARVSSVLLNADRSRLAAVNASGEGQRVLTFSLDRPDLVRRGPIHDAVSNLAFSSDGASLAYVAERAGRRFVVLDDREEPVPPGEELVGLPAIRPDKSGLGILMSANGHGGSVFLRRFFVEGGRQKAAYQGAEGLVYGDDGRSHAFAAEKNEKSFIVANGKEGPPFDRVVSPMFSPDGKYLVYRARKDGKRFVVIADTSGKTIRQHRAYEQVFPVRFTADGNSIAYGVKDGRRLAWKVEAL